MAPPARFRDLVAGIPRFLLLLLKLIGDSQVSRTDRALLLGAVLYTLSPFDLIPDFLPVIGRLDDLYLLALAINRLVRNAGPEIVRGHWDGPEEVLRGLCGSLDELSAHLPAPVQRKLRSRAEGR